MNFLRDRVGALAIGVLLAGSMQGFGSESSKAAGGDVTIDGGYAVHTFTNSGVFTLNSDATVEVLVIGGGGGGGNNGGGGGGAGGFIHSNDWPLVAGVYEVTVGAGGIAPPNNNSAGGSGGNSSIAGLVALGGGGGASRDGGTGGVTGGSGGGGGGSEDVTRRTAGAGTADQGSSGGAGVGGNTSAVGGGGGGAGAAGAAAASQQGGNGGDGLPCSITGSEAWYAGGGGGGKTSLGAVGAGGQGGGGAGTYTTKNPGTPNTGGGGGGGSGGTGSGLGADGGSGVVIVRYALADIRVHSDQGYDFGVVITNSVIDRIYTISNAGESVTLSLTGSPTVAVSGDIDFSIFAQPAQTTLGPGETTTFTLRYDPITIGTCTARVSIASDDATLENYAFMVSGIGDSGSAIAVLGINGLNITNGAVATTALGTDYGAVLANTHSDHIFTITNSGVRDLVIEDISFTGSTTFSLVEPFAASPVAPGDSTAFAIRFDPADNGAFTAQVSVINNMLNMETLSFQLTGVGHAISVLGTNGAVIASGATASIAAGTDFGSRPVGSAPLDRAFVITNMGTVDLSFNTPTLVSDAFSLVEPYPVSPVAPGSSTTFTVRHVPGEVNPAAQVIIAGSASMQTPYVINLKASTSARNWTVLFDSDPGTPGAQDGDGVWSPGVAGWVNTNNMANTVWVNDDTAIIGSGDGAGGVITVAGTIKFRAISPTLVFNPPGEGSYHLQGGTLAFTAYQTSVISVNCNVRIDSTITTGDSPNHTRVIVGNGTVSFGGTSTWLRDFYIANGVTVRVVEQGSFATGSQNPVRAGATFIAEDESRAWLSGYGIKTTIGGSPVAGVPATVIAQGSSWIQIGGGGPNSATYIGNGADSIGIVTVRDQAVVTCKDSRGFSLGYTAGSVGILNLEGGQFICSSSYSPNKGAGEGYINFDGGTLALSGGNVNITSLTRATVKRGGAKFNTQDGSTARTITFQVPLEHDEELGAEKDGGVTKTGTGTLTLSGANTYTGPTTVEAGTLSLTQASLPDAAVVSIASGAILNLNHTSTDLVGGLIIGGEEQPRGTWGKIGSGAEHETARITGNGLLRVVPPSLAGAIIAIW